MILQMVEPQVKRPNTDKEWDTLIMDYKNGRYVDNPKTQSVVEGWLGQNNWHEKVADYNNTSLWQIANHLESNSLYYNRKIALLGSEPNESSLEYLADKKIENRNNILKRYNLTYDDWVDLMWKKENAVLENRVKDYFWECGFTYRPWEVTQWSEWAEIWLETFNINPVYVRFFYYENDADSILAKNPDLQLKKMRVYNEGKVCWLLLPRGLMNDRDYGSMIQYVYSFVREEHIEIWG